MLTFDLLASKVKFASLFVWAIYIYIESIEVTFTQVSEPWPVGLLFKFCLYGSWDSQGLEFMHPELKPCIEPGTHGETFCLLL